MEYKIKPKVKLMSDDATGRNDVQINYLQVVCLNCHAKWGCNPINGTILEEQLVCRVCHPETNQI